jgi:hypothetical protein
MDMDRRRRRLLRSSRASQSSRTRRTFRADNLTTVETSTWASQRRHTHKGGIPTKAAYKDLAAHDVDLIFAAGTTGEFTTQLTRNGSMSARRRPRLGQRPDLLAGRRRLAVPGHATGRGGRRPGGGQARSIDAVLLRGNRVGHLVLLRRHSGPRSWGALYAYLFPARTTTAATHVQLIRIAEISIAGVKISWGTHATRREYVDVLGGRDRPVYSGLRST